LALSFFFHRGEGKAKMAGKKCKGTPLKVFSGKQAKLNRIILPLLEKKALAKEDVFHTLRNLKGYRHTTSKTVCRRMDALNEEGYISPQGTRPGAVKGDCVLYQITQMGQAALKLDRKSGDMFLSTATSEELAAFNKNY
jgi:DNA-binding PadR family transcriptional regulator